MNFDLANPVHNLKQKHEVAKANIKSYFSVDVATLNLYPSSCSFKLEVVYEYTNYFIRYPRLKPEGRNQGMERRARS
jgi:hypothetical protein